MPGRKFSGSNNYRYGFNGKENDNETVGTGQGTQDYGMRIYNPALGKFLSVDPLCDSYPWNSTYAFAENDVIRCIDLDGTEKTEPAYKKENGGYTTAIDNTGRAAINEATIKQLSQAMNYKKNILLHGAPKNQGEIRQGGIYKDPDYIASTTIMNNEAEVVVPFYNETKTLIKGGTVTKGEIIFEAALNLPIFGWAKPALKPLARFIGKEGKLILKGSGKTYMCEEFAADFMEKIAPTLEKDGYEVAHHRIDLKDQGAVIGNLEQQMAKNGVHEFVTVTKDGITTVFDNIYNSGVEIGKYMEEIAGSSRKAGGAISGKDLVEKSVKKK